MNFDFDSVDLRISDFMERWGVLALRYSLALIFIWFGLLKPLGLSPAEPLVRLTVAWMPLLSPGAWVGIIGWWEVAIGITFLFRRTARIAIALLAMQMVGTFMPLVLLPRGDLSARRRTLCTDDGGGQYILKNLLIISSALVVGGTLRPKA